MGRNQTDVMSRRGKMHLNDRLQEDTQSKGSCFGTTLASIAGGVLGGGATHLYMQVTQACEYVKGMPAACTYDISHPLVVTGGILMGAIITGAIASAKINNTSLSGYGRRLLP